MPELAGPNFAHFSESHEELTVFPGMGARRIIESILPLYGVLKNHFVFGWLRNILKNIDHIDTMVSAQSHICEMSNHLNPLN